MRRLIVALFALFMTVLTVNAQVFIGGGLGLNFGDGKSSLSSSESTNSSLGFSISPQVGYYLNNDLSIGLSGSLSNRWSKNNPVLNKI